MKVFLGLFAIFLIVSFSLAVVGSAMNLITIPWLKFDRQVQMNRDIITKTYDADNALYNYHWFKERYESLKAQEKQIENSQQAVESFETSSGPRSSWTFEDKTEDSRLRAVVTGQKNAYEQNAAEYNARAKEVDRAIFKDELPVFFSIKPY